MLICFASIVINASATEGRDVDVKLPRPLQPSETVFVEIEVGSLARGEEIELRTASGKQLGTISPYDVRGGRASGTYIFPAPPDLFTDGHLTIRLFLSDVNHSQRPPSTNEVKSVRAKIPPLKH